MPPTVSVASCPSHEAVVRSRLQLPRNPLCPNFCFLLSPAALPISAFSFPNFSFSPEALLVPSARVAGGMNLVYFPQSLARGTQVEILGEKDLNRWLKKQ